MCVRPNYTRSAGSSPAIQQQRSDVRQRRSINVPAIPERQCAMTTCNRCTSPISPRANFCASCGQRVADRVLSQDHDATEAESPDSNDVLSASAPNTSRSLQTVLALDSAVTSEAPPALGDLLHEAEAAPAATPDSQSNPVMVSTDDTGIHWECPTCRSREIQRVAIRYMAETSSSTHLLGGLTLGSRGQLGLAGGIVGGSSVSDLARHLAPPASPSGPQSVGAVCIVLFVFLSVTFSSCGHPAISSWISGIVCGLLYLGLKLVDAERVKTEASEWQKVFDAWNRLYFCDRCGAIFLPERPEDVA